MQVLWPGPWPANLVSPFCSGSERPVRFWGVLGRPAQANPSRRTKFMRRSIQVALVAMLCVLTTSVAQAQRLDGSLRVTVTDKSGASIQDARVTVTNEATNVSLTATASSAGTYVFPNLLVGS